METGGILSVLDGQIAIVTGAARGIGREIALTLAREGAVLIVVDVDAAGGEETACSARIHAPQSRFEALDITDHHRVQDFIRTVSDQFGRIDILVNNAGVTRPADFFAVGPEDLNRILDVNVKGSFFMMQAAARVMKDAGAGRIVNIASIAGKGYRKTSNIAYAGSKGALIAMTRVAASALGPYGINVNAICPGPTESDMMSGWLAARAAEAGISIDQARGEQVGDIALRRMNSASDIALAVLFLTSPASRNITGQSLNVDGGLIWD